MFEIFKKYDLVDELDSRISNEENIFIEAVPNKIPYILKLIKPYVILEFAMIFIDFLYALVRPNEIGTILNFVELTLIAVNCFPIYFLGKSIYNAILKVHNSYYVVTDRGIHILLGGRSLDYNLYLYEDIKSFTLNKYSFSKNRGDIIFKDSSSQELKTLKDKFLYVPMGLIAVDDAEKIYDILKQVAIQDNPDIFFSDDSSDLKVDYFKDVKKYNKRINIDKDDSIMKRRS